MQSTARNNGGYGLLMPLLLILIITIVGMIGLMLYRYHAQVTADQVKLVPTKSVGAGQKLMVVQYRGGLCPTAEEKVADCNTEYALYGDGSFDGHTKLSTAELQKLQSVIKKTDFLQYKAKAYPRCPSYTDGSDEVLLFPQKYADKSFAICDLEIPSQDQAITWITDLIRAHQQK